MHPCLILCRGLLSEVGEELYEISTVLLADLVRCGSAADYQHAEVLLVMLLEDDCNSNFPVENRPQSLMR